MGSTLEALSPGLHIDVGFFNIGVLTGAEPVYIETGISQLTPYYDRRIRESLGVAGPAHVMLLHSHFDHSGGAARWKRLYPEARFWGSEATDAAMRDPGYVEVIRKTLERMNSNQFYIRLFPGADDTVAAEPLGMDGILGEGTEAPGGLTAWSAPGHSPCSVGLWHAESRTLFVSDAAGVKFPGSGKQWITAFQDYELYLATLERIRGFEAENLVFGHYGMVRGRAEVAAYLADHRERAERFRGQALKLIAEQGLDQAVETLEQDYKNEMQLFPYGVFHWGMKTMLKGLAQ